MPTKEFYNIAVIRGDGIGPEVCDSAVTVLKAAFGQDQILSFSDYEGGAATYLRTGVALPDETKQAVLTADATLHGAIGDPAVTLPDGTEAGQDFSLNLRFQLDIYANIRYVKHYTGVAPKIVAANEGPVDYVVVRENVEGLYAARGGGNLLRDEVATDTLVITRKGTERIARVAFELARKRNGAPLDGKKRVTVCDKANVLRSYSFFRKVCAEVAEDYPDVELDFCMVDALTTHLVSRPGFYDVIVSENMFGDIISDLGPATVGSVGISPTAEVGDGIGYFQAAHGSAPDIAGKGIANPSGTILSAALMLDWLAERHDDARLSDAASRIRGAVEDGFAAGTILTADLGGASCTDDVTRYLCASLAD